MNAVLADVALASSRSLELSLLIKATLVIGIGLLVARVAGRARASVRHLALAATLGALLALPFAGTMAPEIGIPVPSIPERPTASPAAPAPAPESHALSNPPAGRAAALSPATILRTLWLAGIVVSLTPVTLALCQLRRMRRSGLPWRDGDEAVRSLSVDVGLNRLVEILLHEGTAVPFTYGSRHPVIFLPPDAKGWEVDDLRRTFVHELEHVRRHDWAVQLVSRVACALYWFHPLVWVAWRKLGLEAERACDDAVVEREEGTDYAEQLVALAERLSAAQAQPTLGMAHRKDLSARISSVLDMGRRRGPAGLGASAAALGTAALLVLAVAPLRAVPTPTAAETLAPAHTTATADPDAQGRVQRSLGRELYEAATAGDLEGVRELLDAGADANAAIAGDGSPLIAAARTGRADVLTLLMDRGANPDMGVRGDGSPLIAAAGAGHLEVVRLLLDRGADVDLVVPGDENALINASGAGHLDVVQLLVARGADVNARVQVVSWRGVAETRTPLWAARRGGHDEVAAFLLSAGARE